MDTLTADKMYDTSSHITWLCFGKRLSTEHYTDLCKVHGWRYSSYRMMFYNNRRFPQYPAWLEVTDYGTVDYSAERADRLAVRAAKHQAASNTAYTRTRQMMDVIPLGQPILVGHHSEKSDRAYRNKIDRMAHTSVVEQKTADDLRERAKSSEAHQRRQHRPDVIARRIERLETDLRKVEDTERRAVIERELATNRAELESLGGLPVDALEIKAGDYVWSREYKRCKVLKVCKKSLSCLCIDSRFLSDLYPRGYPVSKTTITRKLTDEEIAGIQSA